jgi:hypothetical protein
MAELPNIAVITKDRAEQIAIGDIQKHFVDLTDYDIVAALQLEDIWLIITKFWSRSKGERHYLHVIAAADGVIRGHIDATDNSEPNSVGLAFGPPGS